MANEFFSRQSDIRNQMGQPLSNPRLAALQAQLEAKTLGSASGSQDVAAIGMLAGMESPAVQAYVAQAVELVQAHLGTVGQLQQVYPLLESIRTLIQADPTLSPKQRKHGIMIMQRLQQFVGKKIALDSRVSVRVKNAVRQKTTAWRSALTEKMQGSQSFLLRNAGHLLRDRPRESGPSPIQQDIANVRASSLTTFADNDAAARLANAPQRVTQPVERERAVRAEPGFSPLRHPVSEAPSGSELDRKAPPIFKRILDTDLKIYKEVEAVKHTLIEQKELDESQAEALRRAQERSADNTIPAETTASLTAAMPTTKGSAFGRLGAFLLSGLTGLTSGIVSAISTAAIAWGPSIAIGIGVAVASYLAGLGFGKFISWLQTIRNKLLLNEVNGGSAIPRTVVEGIIASTGTVLGMPNMGQVLNEASANGAFAPSGSDSGTKTPARTMRMSESGQAALIQREGLGPKDGSSYQDKDGGYVIGPGMQYFRGEKVTKNTKYTPKEIEAEFKHQLHGTYSDIVRTGLGDTPVSQQMFDALVSHAWNNPAQTVRMVAKLKSGQELTLEDWQRGATVKGAPSAALRERYRKEYEASIAVPAASSAPPGELRPMSSHGEVARTPSPQASLNPRLSAPTLSSAQQAAGANRGGTNVVVVQQMASRQAAATPIVQRVFQRIDPDQTDATIRAIRNTSGSALI
jgi:GH24 family phage-related lysozyme (muramidase)